jgi:hypothetical protein
VTPHTQRVIGYERGSCFATAIASVLDLDLDAVPNFVLFGTGWLEALGVWAWEHGIHVTHLHYDDDLSGLHIAGGPGPRKREDGTPIPHAVVAEGRKLVHDPHPSGLGIDLATANNWWRVTPCQSPHAGRPKGCDRCGVAFGDHPESFVAGSQTWRRGPA